MSSPTTRSRRSSAARTSCSRRSRLGEAPAYEPVGSLGWCDALRVGFGEERAQRLADPREPLLEVRLVPALVLEADQLDDAAGADDVVRGVEDAPLAKPVRILGLG